MIGKELIIWFYAASGLSKNIILSYVGGYNNLIFSTK